MSFLYGERQHTVGDLLLDDPGSMLADIERAAEDLVAEGDITEAVRAVLDRVAEELRKVSEEHLGLADPYLVHAMQRAVIAGLQARARDDRDARYREMRIALEQLRHALRDITEELPIRQEEPVKSVLRWLAAVLDVPVSTLAAIIDVHPRTVQRWLSETDPSTPRTEESRRIRVLARVANHLRHALTGPGVLRWLERPHPALGRKTPLDLLGDPGATPRLLQLASAARSGRAG